MGTMNISLPAQLEKLVEDRVKSGLYTSASEVVREALRLLESQDREADIRLKRLAADVAVGTAQLDQGRAAEFDSETMERIRRVGRTKLAAQDVEG